MKIAKEITESNEESFWEGILHGGKIISDEEAEELQEMVKRLRKESWVRKTVN